jgi:hypothetical protein
MLSQSFSIPTICIVNNLEDMAVEIHGSLGARIPKELGSMATTDDLWKAVNGKHLWLSKGGPSYLSVSIIFHGEVISDPDRANWVSQRICNWEVSRLTCLERLDEAMLMCQRLGASWASG